MDMVLEVQNLINEYTRWLSDKTKLRQIKDLVEITTPYLDRHNDYLQIYVRKENGGYIISIKLSVIPFFYLIL